MAMRSRVRMWILMASMFGVATTGAVLATPAAGASGPAAQAGTSSPTPGSGSDIFGAGSSWSTLEAVALRAVSNYRGDGPLTADVPPSPVLVSSVSTPSQVVGISQRTVVADDGSGTVVVQMSLLGNEQLVVDEMAPSSGFRGDALVLAPGSGAVESSVALPGASITGALSGSTSPPGPATVPGCYGDPQSPTVIGSIFGPLVQGEGVVVCLSAEPLGVIVSIYQGGSQVGGTAGGTGTGNYLAVDAYSPCTVIAGTSTFQTAELYSVYGALQGGGVSAFSSLHCS